MKKLQTFIGLLSIVALVAILGCASVKDTLTPTYIPPEAIKATDTGDKIPLIKFMPYTSLSDAKYVKTKMDHQYLMNKELLAGSIKASEAFQQKLFSPRGPIGLLLPGAAGLGIGSFLISKPDDKKKIIDLEKNKGE